MAPSPLTPVPHIDDEADVIAVIHAETQAFKDADFQAWASCWIQEPRAINVLVSSIGQSVMRGWEEISRHTRSSLKDQVGCGMVAFEQRNFHVAIDSHTAWATFDQQARDVHGGQWDSFETRVLERTSEGWKIVYLSFVERNYDRLTQDALSVDSTGQIVWASDETRETLKHHPHLSVSAGRIRAARRDWDKVLQAAIAQASRYHGFFEQWRFSQENGTPFHFPAVLGEADDGGVIVVFVSVRDGMTHLHFDASGSLDRRLAAAQTIFGLSNGQLRVARHIANGLGLKEAAAELGISVNTARTHLTRLYEKTGVNAQTALVRLLLSVG